METAFRIGRGEIVRRRTFDRVTSISGLVIAVVLAVGGILLLWGGNFAHETVTDELTSQKIAFSSDTQALPPELQPYAGLPVVDGPSAQAYADLINVHLSGVAAGQTYSEVSEAWIAGGRSDEELAGQRMTLFIGETLRGMLLNAYAFWTIGTIALVAAWCAFAASAIIFVLACLGFVHMARTSDQAVAFEVKESSRV